MFSLRVKRAAGALLVPLFLFGSSAIAGGSAQARAAHEHSRHGRHHIEWTNEAPPIVIGVPQCDATPRCLYPWTETGVSHGDLEGTYIASGVATVSATGALTVVRTDIFTGTVAGCGTGTVVSHGTEDIGPSSSATWSIVAGFGTGDLVDVTGHGTAVGAAGATVTSTVDGVIDCGR